MTCSHPAFYEVDNGQEFFHVIHGSVEERKLEGKKNLNKLLTSLKVGPSWENCALGLEYSVPGTQFFFFFFFIFTYRPPTWCISYVFFLDHHSPHQLGAELKARAISHLEEVSDKGIQAMSAESVIAVLLPTTAYILRLKCPPARKMIESGTYIKYEWLSYFPQRYDQWCRISRI